MTETREKVMRGLPLDDVLIIDCHCHLGDWRCFNIPDNSAEGMLRSMNALGMDFACVTAHAAIGPDFRLGNEMVVEAVRQYPDRFIGYVTLNPNYREDIRSEVEQCMRVPGMKGIKLHPELHGCPIDYKYYQAAYEEADRRQCPVLIHTWGTAAVAVVDRLAVRYPGANFILGHAGAEILAMEDAIDVVNRRTNVYVDLAISMLYEGNVEWLVREMGSEKVLFGTDMPFMDPRSCFARVAMADIGEQEMRNVFGLNMKRLLKI